MKQLVLCLSVFASSFAFAQNGLEQIIVEKYYVSNAADAAQADVDALAASQPKGVLPVGSVTYRIYADMLPHYKLIQVYADGTREQPVRFKTTTSFYNHPSGGSTPSATAIGSIKNNLLALDSYVALAGAAKLYYGVLKTDDNAEASIFTTNAGNILINDASAMGTPLTQKDGYLIGTGLHAIPAVSTVLFDESPISDGTVISDSLVFPDGSWYCTTGAYGPDSITNKVLIGQFTTNGKFSFEINVLIQSTVTERGEFYVAKNPQPAGNPATTNDDVMIKSLTFNSDSMTTSINDHPVKLNNNLVFSVYPNPVTDNITLELAAAEQNSKGSYTIYGIVGNVIAHKELNGVSGNYKETIDMSSLSQGLYTIELTVNGVSATKKIIKN